MGRKLYSCDICQDVCPWNKNAKSHSTPEFAISDELAQHDKGGLAHSGRRLNLNHSSQELPLRELNSKDLKGISMQSLRI